MRTKEQIIKELSKEINTFSNFSEHSDTIEWYYDGKKSEYDRTDDYIYDLIDNIFYDINTEDEMIDFLSDYKYETALDQETDSKIDVYYNKMYSSVPYFADAINEAKENFGSADTIEKEITQGQYYAYDQLNRYIIEELKTFLGVEN